MCTYPGCKHVLVLDGNQKNRRDICGAQDAGWVQNKGLPGHIKTGCTSSPAYKSHFCEDHKVRSAEAEPSSNEIVIESLLAKKETRNGRYFQV